MYIDVVFVLEMPKFVEVRRYATNIGRWHGLLDLLGGVEGVGWKLTLHWKLWAGFKDGSGTIDTLTSTPIPARSTNLSLFKQRILILY